MKYLYISRNQSISFNEDYWYINGIEQKRPIEEIRTTEELAKNGTKQYMRSLLTNLFSHFKHIAILTAAGTSMDNGTHRAIIKFHICRKLFRMDALLFTKLITILGIGCIVYV